MISIPGKSELHMHSIFSDGEFSPTELVRIAGKNGVSLLSLTDHDTFEGIGEFIEAAKGTGISAFPGIEITTRYRDSNVHLLAYFKSPDSIDSELMEEVARMSAKRESRMRELVEKINQVVPERLIFFTRPRFVEVTHPALDSPLVLFPGTAAGFQFAQGVAGINDEDLSRFRVDPVFFRRRRTRPEQGHKKNKDHSEHHPRDEGLIDWTEIHK